MKSAIGKHNFGPNPRKLANDNSNFPDRWRASIEPYSLTALKEMFINVRIVMNYRTSLFVEIN